jgi:hypothetical protein
MPNRCVCGAIGRKFSHPERKEARGSIASEAVRKANAMEAGDRREARRGRLEGRGNSKWRVRPSPACSHPKFIEGRDGGCSASSAWRRKMGFFARSPWVRPAQSYRFSAHSYRSQTAGCKRPRVFSPQQSYQNVSRETFWYDCTRTKGDAFSSQRGELERILVATEDEWLRLVGKLNAARGKEPRGPAVKFRGAAVRRASRDPTRSPTRTGTTATAKPETRESWFLPEMSAFAGARLQRRSRAAPSA